MIRTLSLIAGYVLITISTIYPWVRTYNSDWTCDITILLQLINVTLIGTCIIIQIGYASIPDRLIFPSSIPVSI
ncbi:MAG: hypothetical protein IPG00_14255 [Saprospiraceae bacterium]|nr:hypothetical protein [Saprospiraceae bacterium]